MEKKDNETLYKIGEHYESHYDDDDSTFLCYDAETKSLCTREWTTRFACPSYYSYPKIDIEDGIRDGKVLVEDVANAMMDWLDDSKEISRRAKNIIDGDLRTEVRYNLPCTVKGGRKYKGDAILIDVERKEFGMGYGRTGAQYIARLLTPEGSIANATSCYVHVKLSEEEIMERMKGNLLAMDKIALCRSMFKVCSNDEFRTFRKYVYDALFPICHDYDEAVDKALQADKEAKQNKHLQWLKERRVGLLGWCRTTFEGKSEDEIQCICDRIMKKKYGETCIAV